MRKVILLYIALASTLNGMAQTPEATVNGSVADSKKAPVEFATIVLLSTADSAIVQTVISDAAGRFSFSKVPDGAYVAIVRLVGFDTGSSPVFQAAAGSAPVVLAPIQLQEMAVELAGVEVTARKPLIEQQVDKLVVNVDASLTNVGATALEVLEKSPGVTVDKNGGLSLKGKPEVLVLVDGKPSYLSGTELTSLLNSMNASQLSQIEIMTNPSAKYDAAGNAGVINIITKRGMGQGLNGSLTASYGQGKYAKSNNTLLLHYQTNRLNLFLNYGYSLNNGFMNFDIQRNFYGPDGSKVLELDQQSDRVIQSQTHSLKTGLEYFINPHNSIGLVTTGFLNPQQQDGLTTTSLLSGSGHLTSIEKTTRTVDNSWKNGTVNLNFHAVAEENKREVSANVDYLHYDFAGDQEIGGRTLSPDQTLLAAYNLKNTLPLTIDIHSGRFDYSKSIGEEMHLETGVKSSWVKTENVSDFFSVLGDRQVLDSTFSNAFRYSENINAAYINLNKKLSAWTVQLGLRLENTQYKGIQSSVSQASDSSFSRQYTSLFPTAFVRYEANDQHQLALSVGRRIDRPAYQQLNPFIGFIDQYTYSTGNPFLQPQFSTNAELSHIYKNQFTATLSYSVVQGMINEMFVQDDSLIIRSVGNIGTRYNLGITESVAFRHSNWYMGTVFANLYQNSYDGEINGYAFEAKQLTLLLNSNNQFNFSNGWSAELSGTYASRNRDEGQSIVLPAGQVAAGIAKQLFEEKASLKLTVRDIFYTQNPKEIQDFQDVRSTLRITRDTRVLNLALVYRFGAAAKSKPATPSPTEEQQRVRTY